MADDRSDFRSADRSPARASRSHATGPDRAVARVRENPADAPARPRDWHRSLRARHTRQLFVGQTPKRPYAKHHVVSKAVRRGNRRDDHRLAAQADRGDGRRARGRPRRLRCDRPQHGESDCAAIDDLLRDPAAPGYRGRTGLRRCERCGGRGDREVGCTFRDPAQVRLHLRDRQPASGDDLYSRLEVFAREHWSVADIKHRWSAQDLVRLTGSRWSVGTCRVPRGSSWLRVL